MASVYKVGADGLCTFYNVILAETGTWAASTGEATFTTGDFQSAVAAVASDPTIKTPRLKIGHVDPRFTPDGDNGIFDGTPALGKFINLRLDTTGQKIVGDLVGVPEWLAKIMPTAFPTRSVEGYWNVKTSSGVEHDFVLTAVSLLGIEMPAVETLEDLQVLFSAEGPDGVEVVEGTRVAAARGGTMPQKVMASLSVEDIRRSFYDDFATEESGRYYWWIRAVYVEPGIIIADGDTDALYAVPYTASGDSEVEFGDPVEVFTQFVEKDSGKVAASKSGAFNSIVNHYNGHTADAKYDSAENSRLDNRPKEVKMGIDIPALRERLSLTAEQLPDDADEATVNAVLANPPSTEETPDAPAAEETTETDAPEGAPVAIAAERGVVVDKDTLAELQRNAAAGVEARNEQLSASRTAYVDKAVKAGKFPPSARDAYLAQLSKGGEIEKQTREFIDTLAENTVPVTETGTAGDAEQVAASAGYDEAWLSPAERARVEAARQGQSVPTRVIVEA